MPGSEAAFEALYGTQGGWMRLFQRSRGYLGTDLLRDTADAPRYLTIDRWRTRADPDTFVQGAREEYAALDQQGDTLTIEETRLTEIET